MSADSRTRPGSKDPWWLRMLLVTAAVGILTLLIIVPIVNVFAQALSAGLAAFWTNLTGSPETRHAIFLTLTIAPAAVLVNTVFGVVTAWSIARFRFPGRTLLITLIDLPFSVSPVVAGLVIVLWFGRQGILGPALDAANVPIVFAWPGILLATIFVTFPFVTRELIPLLEEIGPDEELAALTLGARSWRIFWHVTLPNIRWGLLYGVILCNARAMGEFGAVYVVSGRITGETDTMPIRIEKLFQEYDTPASFALASALTLLALATLALKTLLERKVAADKQGAGLTTGQGAI